jgi:hypothetical protein
VSLRGVTDASDAAHPTTAGACGARPGVRQDWAGKLL